jgi:hypothetical protein
VTQNLLTEVIRPALAAEKIPWYGWHAFRGDRRGALLQSGATYKIRLTGSPAKFFKFIRLQLALMLQ